MSLAIWEQKRSQPLDGYSLHEFLKVKESRKKTVHSEKTAI